MNVSEDTCKVGENIGHFDLLCTSTPQLAQARFFRQLTYYSVNQHFIHETTLQEIETSEKMVTDEFSNGSCRNMTTQTTE